MSTMRVAKRYAEALMESAQEEKILDAVTKDIGMIAGVVRASKEFRVFLASPIVPVDKKRKVIDEMFSRKLKPMTMAFLRLLIDKGREGVLPDIITQFGLLRDEALGIISVEVRAAVELSGPQEKALSKQLEQYTGKKVRVTFSLDTSVKGGFIARAGDTVFDASVRRQLEILRERFVEGSVERN